ncbi:hypothetical protein OBBRIDRAFT_729311 [Obba rivulosa]|uniref:Calcium uniporter protein, mitochondrial n=1 Tax=Obba rivulosa TaxID=1052685 RepID=A0A8E2B451_9APHY|nr:hypothetical protein OBBRIDRAFT_729311 [Obba rivulosa]
MASSFCCLSRTRLPSQHVLFNLQGLPYSRRLGSFLDAERRWFSIHARAKRSPIQHIPSPRALYSGCGAVSSPSCSALHAALRPTATGQPGPTRRRNSTSAQGVENINVTHARFLAEAPHKAKFRKDEIPSDLDKAGAEESDSNTDGKGKLSPTSSHLFRLILPLAHLRSSPAGSHNPLSTNTRSHPPTVFLLHPSQPLAHVSQLILASLAPATPRIAFRSKTPGGRTFEWADSTDVADFVRDASRVSEFEIVIEGLPPRPDRQANTTDPGTGETTTISVEVPTFADRTRFLRRRLSTVERELEKMEGLKRLCDQEAHRGARRMALGGFGMLVVYWALVARLTFWDFGWDVMEPITYLSGLSTVILGYLWFLYQGREMSYSSILHHSISARREALYRERGLDIERWAELVREAKWLRREIARIAEDYDEHRWTEQAQKKQDAEDKEDREVRDARRVREEERDQTGVEPELDEEQEKR